MLLLTIPIAFSIPVAKQSLTESSKFALEPIFNGKGATPIVFDTAGCMLVAEKQGRILVALPDARGGFGTPTLVLGGTLEGDKTQGDIFRTQANGTLLEVKPRWLYAAIRWRNGQPETIDSEEPCVNSTSMVL